MLGGWENVRKLEFSKHEYILYVLFLFFLELAYNRMLMKIGS